MGDIDVSAITDMGELFERSKRTDFSGIESWDISKVEDMDSMFYGAKSFSQSLDSWNLSVEKLKKCFEKHDDF